LENSIFSRRQGNVIAGKSTASSNQFSEKMSVMHGLFLGLAVGPSCLTYCVPVLIPYLLGEDRGVRRSAAVLGQFLAGRFFGYIAFGLLAWMLNQALLQTASARELLFGVAYIVLAGLLAWYGQFAPPTLCAGKSLNGISGVLKRHWPMLFPLGLGFFTGISLCPPFLLAFTDAANSGSAWGSVLFFMAFFLGTSFYFIPLPLLGAFGRFSTLRIIGKLAALVMSVFYLFLGIIAFINGIHKL
jgi:sulfite exporter TauE/SafE